MSSDEAAAHHLLTVLEERDLLVSLDDVLLAFESAETKGNASSWVQEYLEVPTLLSREELELYCAISKRGTARLDETEALNIRPHYDNDLNAAVEALQNSTAAIEKQCHVLEAQKEALEALKALNKPDLQVEHTRNDRRRREIQEKARLDIAVEDVSSSITETLTEVQRDTKSEHSSLVAFTGERLASDDKILTALPNIASNIGSNTEVSSETKSIDQWCQAIASFRAAEIKARVDSTYQTKLLSRDDLSFVNGSQDELFVEKQALQGELETLYTEIASVAEMVVDRELREPIRQAKERSEGQRQQAQCAWLTYVLSTLEFMMTRLNTINKHAQDLDGFLKALESISAAVLSEAVNATSQPQAVFTKRASTTLKSLVSPPVKVKSGEAVKIPSTLQDVLRHAGLAHHWNSAEEMREALAEAQREKQEKWEDVHAQAASSVSQNLAEALGQAEADVRAIFDALYANTKYQRINFTSQSLEDQVKSLEAAIGDIDMGIAKVESEELSMGELKVANFVSKWASI
ncbi:hypothetical protein K432DRAFT_349774 [Lepidopterella palustris CBS 459.81]|uniref:HAUS augmin-like complex subunit 3 N-terminal domain-containing protein n=1 Tax=Lepidopterella palustris CBS 459.81 TaxID=1314670 RepID=A0A8E2JH17_9PEZI|nr:hypothetical protein K432DRAFT_349774 [Lepidopterella palustris CBS 459.81]